MKRDFRIDLTELAGDDETRRVTETLMASASGNTANQDADRFVAVGGQPDDGKVETGDRDRFAGVGSPDDGKVETGDRDREIHGVTDLAAVEPIDGHDAVLGQHEHARHGDGCPHLARCLRPLADPSTGEIEHHRVRLLRGDR